MAGNWVVNSVRKSSASLTASAGRLPLRISASMRRCSAFSICRWRQERTRVGSSSRATARDLFSAFLARCATCVAVMFTVAFTGANSESVETRQLPQ